MEMYLIKYRHCFLIFIGQFFQPWKSKQGQLLFAIWRRLQAMTLIQDLDLNTMLGRWGGTSGCWPSLIPYGKQCKSDASWLNPNFPKLEGILHPSSPQMINIAPPINFWKPLPPSEPQRVHRDMHNVTKPWYASCPRKLLWAWILIGWPLASYPPILDPPRFFHRTFGKWWCM